MIKLSQNISKNEIKTLYSNNSLGVIASSLVRDNVCTNNELIETVTSQAQGFDTQVIYERILANRVAGAGGDFWTLSFSPNVTKLSHKCVIILVQLTFIAFLQSPDCFSALVLSQNTLALVVECLKHFFDERK